MSEKSQSRYSIMDELNNRKLKAKEKLASLERALDENVFETNKQIASKIKAIERLEDTYEQDFKNKEREMTVKLQMKTADFNREKAKLEREIKNLQDNYQSDFENSKKDLQTDIKGQEDGLERYKKVEALKIDEKKQVITEIEKSIEDLKEMSKETVKQ